MPQGTWNAGDVRAGGALHLLAAAYALHSVGSLVLAPGRPPFTPGLALFFCLLVGTVTSLILWSAWAVRRGGRLVGAVILSCLLAMGGLYTGALALDAGASTYWPFALIECLLVGFAGYALLALTLAHSARMER